MDSIEKEIKSAEWRRKNLSKNGVLQEEVVLKDQYRDETGFDVYSDGNDGYSYEYVHWLEEKCIALQNEIDVTDNLLKESNKVLDAIPECAVHGRCIPHAIEWIKSKI